MDNGSYLLEANELTKTFGGLAAVKDVSFRLREGIIKAIIGPNGAGKTTLYDLLTGIYQPDQGSVLFQGQELIGLPSHEITILGIARTFQTIQLFPNMTVMENVQGFLQAPLG
jgi:branched-chain amino acid transport system ATP-binding protein